MFKTLVKYIGEFKRDAVLTPVLVVMEVIMEVIIPIIMAVIIDYGLESRSLGKVVLIGLAMIVAAMLALWFGVESGLLTPSRQFRITATAKFFLSLLPCIYGLINITDYRNTFFNPNQAAVQAQMVILRKAPYLVRIIFIMGSPAFIQPFHFSDSLIIRHTVSFHKMLCLKCFFRMNIDIQTVSCFFQNRIRTASHNHTGFFFCKFRDDLSLDTAG